MTSKQSFDYKIVDQASTQDDKTMDLAKCFLEAARIGNAIIFKELLKGVGVANVNVQDKDRNTALHFASESGYLAGVKELLKNGAKVNCLNKENKTPMHFKCSIWLQKMVILPLQKNF